MDITTQAVVETAAIHIKGADGEYLYDNGKPVRIHIFGPGTEQASMVEARQSARAVKRLADNDGKISLPPPEERAAEEAEDLADITASFENLTYPPAGDAQGKPLFRALYADKKLGFIARQISRAHADWGKFKPGSTGN